MPIIYVDESGDAGRTNSPTDYFALASLMVDASQWEASLEGLVDFRHTMRKSFGFRQRDEIKGRDFFRNSGGWTRAKDRLTDFGRSQLYKDYLTMLAKMQGVRCVCIFIRKNWIKNPEVNIIETAWSYLLQRLQTNLDRRSPATYGVLIVDQGFDFIIKRLRRRMRVFSYVGSRFGPEWMEFPITRLLDDPVPRASWDSYFLQSCDMIAYALHRKVKPAKNYGADLFNTLDPILVKEASDFDPQGVVFWPREDP